MRICWILRSFITNEGNKQKHIEFYTATAMIQKRNNAKVSNATAVTPVTEVINEKLIHKMRPYMKNGP